MIQNLDINEMGGCWGGLIPGLVAPARSSQLAARSTRRACRKRRSRRMHAPLEGLTRIYGDDNSEPGDDSCMAPTSACGHSPSH
jgi:hypothetical protein